MGQNIGRHKPRSTIGLSNCRSNVEKKEPFSPNIHLDFGPVTQNKKKNYIHIGLDSHLFLTVHITVKLSNWRFMCHQIQTSSNRVALPLARSRRSNNSQKCEAHKNKCTPKRIQKVFFFFFFFCYSQLLFVFRKSHLSRLQPFQCINSRFWSPSNSRLNEKKKVPSRVWTCTALKERTTMAAAAAAASPPIPYSILDAGLPGDNNVAWRNSIPHTVGSGSTTLTDKLFWQRLNTLHKKSLPPPPVSGYTAPHAVQRREAWWGPFFLFPCCDESRLLLVYRFE